MATITCPHCGGTTRCGCASCRVNNEAGICNACHGHGKIQISDNAHTCPHCGGTTRCGCASCRVGNEAGICKACNGTGRG